MTHTLHVNTAPTVMLCLYPYYLSIFLVHLFYMYTIHESAIWKICAHAQNRAEAPEPCISTNISVYPEMTSFFFLLAVFQGQLDSPFFFSCFYSRAGGEDDFVYKALLFLLSRLYACAIQQVRGQVNHTLPSSIVRISFLLQ